MRFMCMRVTLYMCMRSPISVFKCAFWHSEFWFICKFNNLRREVDSIREAVFTVSPNKQYRGILFPTTPATTGPENTKLSDF